MAAERLAFRAEAASIDPVTEEIHEFVSNPRPGPASKQGAKGRGLERPSDVAFGPDGAMYITDFSLVEVTPGGYVWTPRTGVIWKVSRVGHGGVAVQAKGKCRRF